MSLLMPEQETDPQVDEPTSIQSLAIISEFLFNYERWCANDEILLSDQLEEPQLEEKWGLGLSQVQAFVSILWLCLMASFWENKFRQLLFWGGVWNVVFFWLLLELLT